VNYSNTLEHLNILDEDYYFKLLDFMQQQQLAETMLLFDEINQKGFEGDTLLDGFTEFIRNLLVCKDPKAAALLDVAEDFKKKYIRSSQLISTGWLIAALNILNDCTINYKQARNKRLHLEMALIKLTYLQQAVELVSNEGQVSKKKVAESARSIAFRSLPIIQIKENLAENKAAPVKHEAALIIEDPVIEKIVKKPVPVAVPETAPSAPASLSSLQKIRQQLTEKNKNGNGVKELTEENLKSCWEQFIEKLEVRKNHSAVTNFRMTSLKPVDNNCLEITVETAFQQKFIEAERSELIDHLQRSFNNRSLIYQITICPKGEVAVETEKPLTRKELYNKLVEQYPNIKELRDRLKLELD
jgi:DNA polymerase-3 subunit gamma/tau